MSHRTEPFPMTSKAGSASGCVIGSKGQYNVFQPIRATILIRLSCASPETLGVLHSTKHSGLSFRKFAAVDETALYAISRKEWNLARFTKILEPFSYRVVPFYLIFLSEFCGTVFRISEIQSFTFHLPTPWRPESFGMFGWMESTG